MSQENVDFMAGIFDAAEGHGQGGPACRAA
jgi:hypothetical protein